MRVIAFLAMLVMMATSSLSEESKPFKYVGSVKCKMCHKTVKQGEQYGIWKEGPHAKAYETLAGDEAIKVGKERGIDNPQKSDQCVYCHITAFGVADSLKMETLTLEEGVSCEACHGPGSEYKKMSIMKNREKAIAAGLQVIDEKTCTICHNEESPAYKPFKFEEAVKKIPHPTPEKEEKAE